MKDIFIQSNENLDDFFSNILPELALRESPQGHPLQLIQRRFSENLPRSARNNHLLSRKSPFVSGVDLVVA